MLMLAQFYPPIIGGEERHVHKLSLELVARGYDVAAATLWQEGESESQNDQGVRIYRVRASMQRASILFRERGRQNSPPFADPQVLWALQSIITRERPDIIHAHNWIVHSFIPLKVWSKADCPTHTRILQSWPHGAVMSAWSRCTIALTPSIWPDPCPTVAMEAMAMGKPVISSRIGGLDTVVGGETGFLVAPGDPQALREALLCLLTDPTRRCRMGMMAKQRVVEFQAKTVVPRIEQVYMEVLA